MGNKYDRECKGGDDCRDEQHLCKIVKYDPGSIRKIVKDSRYFCKKCGRSANKPSYLCRPDLI